MSKPIETLAQSNYVFVLTNRHAVRLTISQAHDLVMQLCESIANAQGHQDVLDGKVSDPRTCPKCKARNITANHACKKVKGHAPSTQ